MNNLNQYPTNISVPNQRVSRKARTKKWWSDTVDSKITLAVDNEIEELKDNMIANYMLWDNQLDTDDVERILNPMNLRGNTFPAKPQHYPIGNQKIKTLIGEELNRNFPIKAFLVNEEAISEKERSLMDQVIEKLMDITTNPKITLSDEQLKEKIEEVADWARYDIQDIREKYANSMIQFIKYRFKIDLMKNSGFKDLLISGHEVYKWELINNSYRPRKVNPLGLYTYGMGDSHNIEDADVILERRYESRGSIVDRYADELTPEILDALDRKSFGGEGDTPKNSLYSNDHYSQDTVTLENGYVKWGDGTTFGRLKDHYEFSDLAAGFDDYGNVLMEYLTWRSYRLIKVYEYEQDEETIIEYFDEDDIIPDYLGEKTLKKVWVNEWLEAIRIAGRYVIHTKRVPVQPFQMDTLSLHPCSSGYVGSIMKTGNGLPVSMMDIIKPFAYMFDSIMMKTELIAAKMHGPIIRVDLSRIPNEWSFEEWAHQAFVNGLSVTDSLKESDEGTYSGIVGHVPDQTGAPINPDFMPFIQANIQLMAMLEEQMSTATGVTRQREGNVYQRETKGGIERAVNQSTYNTEEFYMLHDDIISRMYEAGVMLNKTLHRNKGPQVLQYWVDDGNIYRETIDNDVFSSGDYGIVVGNNKKAEELQSLMREYAGNILQSRQISFTNFISIYNDPSNASIRRKIEKEEFKIQKREQEATQQANQIEIAKIQDKQADRDMDKYKADLEYDKAITVQSMKNEDGKESVEEERLKSERSERVEDKKIAAQERMKDKELASKERVEDKKEVKKKKE